jgi:hypothetical protein
MKIISSKGEETERKSTENMLNDAKMKIER